MSYSGQFNVVRRYAILAFTFIFYFFKFTETDLLTLVWVFDGEDEEWAKKKYNIADKDLSKDSNGPAFKYRKSKVFRTPNSHILLCYPVDFCVDMILHCVRGDLPFNFPDLETFEKYLSPKLRDAARSNFKRMLDQSQKGHLTSDLSDKIESSNNDNNNNNSINEKNEPEKGN